MAVKKRRSKHRAALSANEQAWLHGDKDSGFIQFLQKAKLRALWEEYGDKESMEWNEGDARPVAKWQ